MSGMQYYASQHDQHVCIEIEGTQFPYSASGLLFKKKLPISHLHFKQGHESTSAQIVSLT